MKSLAPDSSRTCSSAVTLKRSWREGRAVAIEKPFQESELDRAIQRALDAADNNHKGRAVKLSNE
jgi:hypothetical protein